MARLGRRRGGGGVFRTLERIGVTRGVFGASKGWFYVGTGLWTLRKLRSFGERKPEVLMRETLRPGDRVVIANGVATIESASQAQVREAGRKALSKRQQRRAARRSLVTQGDLSRRQRRRTS